MVYGPDVGYGLTGFRRCATESTLRKVAVATGVWVYIIYQPGSLRRIMPACSPRGPSSRRSFEGPRKIAADLLC